MIRTTNTRRSNGDFLGVYCAILCTVILLTFGNLGVNLGVYSRLWINDKLYMSTSQAKANTWGNSPSAEEKCHTSLHDAALSLARLYSPPGSPSFEKTRLLLHHVDHFYHSKSQKKGIFVDSSTKIENMLKGFGITQISNSSSPVRHSNTTALVYYSAFLSGKEQIDDQPRIVIQTEQLNAQKKIRKHVQKCHKSPLCVVWDWSEFNWNCAQKHLGNATDSIMLLPTMFQGRLDRIYFRNIDKPTTLPLTERPADIAFFGLITGRRSRFKQEFIELYNQTTQGALPVLRVERLKSEKELVKAYSNAKICPIVHSYHYEAAGEFHRLGDLRPSGCIPAMETISDDVFWTHILSQCGGVIFANYTDLPRVLVQQLMDLRQPNHAAVAETRQEAAMQWWKEGIHWDKVLRQLFNP
mmetsp:Transcript_8697/g.15855  ORF Transcript_8697/g.15855 Transcript_8697/m.15855 type:complete len:412 (+) Transcript_8697:285-1520(+)|eukprot:CAMPEP_0178752828 /NCGR_PEP_ID=MMETSP0744-20121128/11278_1 /TAXON_ID=913974 /ORGANISM="Nitzschia punctata, Strain CCMP561" /LENGTH=411 /DNA_ID=CAMNT_0020406587 /DNA_START=223 /DNA_END=1458 /DNA_ORIENTATION=+